MILREWKATAAADRQEEYPKHFRASVLPLLRGSAGFRGAALTSRPVGDLTEFTILTKWDSLDSIRAFAGESIHVAVIDPAAIPALESFDREVRHYTMLVCEW